MSGRTLMDCKPWSFRLEEPEDESQAEREARRFWEEEWGSDEIEDEDDQ